MATNSFNQIYIHFVIVVKDRAKLITPTLEPILHKYISSISPSSLMLWVKQHFTKFLKNEGLCKNFSWQEGYASFSYSKSQVKDVYNYIANQKEHHRKRTTQEEIDDIIKKFNEAQLLPQ